MKKLITATLSVFLLSFMAQAATGVKIECKQPSGLMGSYTKISGHLNLIYIDYSHSEALGHLQIKQGSVCPKCKPTIDQKVGLKGTLFALYGDSESYFENLTLGSVQMDPKINLVLQFAKGGKEPVSKLIINEKSSPIECTREFTFN